MKKYQVLPHISDEALTALSARSYEKNYTEVPNNCLTDETFRTLSKIFAAITNGGQLDIEGTTFLVKAFDGNFRSILPPAVYRQATYDDNPASEPQLEDYLVLRWGEEFISINVSPEGLAFANPDPKAKLELKLMTKPSGKYEETCLVVVLKNTKDKEIFSAEFPVRSADWNNKIDPDVADVLLESEDIAGFLDMIQPRTNPNRSQGSGDRLQGHFVKAAQMPEGEYEITSYREKLGGQYGPDYFIQAKILSPIPNVLINRPAEDCETWESGKEYSQDTTVLVGDKAYTSQVDGNTENPTESKENWTEADSDRWVTDRVTLEDWAIIKPNNALKKMFSAHPVISKESPARLTLHSHGVYNGWPTVKAQLDVASYEVDSDSINLNF